MSLGGIAIAIGMPSMPMFTLGASLLLGLTAIPVVASYLLRGVKHVEPLVIEPWLSPVVFFGGLGYTAGWRRCSRTSPRPWRTPCALRNAASYSSNDTLL